MPSLYIPSPAKKSYINIPMLMRVVGYLLTIEAIFMLLPLLASIIYREHAFWGILISVAITGSCGCLMTLLKPKSRDMGKRDAIILTGFTWIVLSLFGMLPFLLCGTHINVIDAFFETMSGFTTTGASVLPSLRAIPKSILLWRCLTQWFGGLGIILFTLAVVPMLNTAGGMQLFNAEVTGITHDKLRPRVSYTAKGLLGVYILLTGLLIVLLSLSEMDPYDAICYGLSTMSTGGFATNDISISVYNSVYIKSVILIFMFLGGVNFTLIYNAARGQVKPLWRNDALRWYLRITLFGALAFSVSFWLQGTAHTFEQLTLDPLLQSISVLSSTGITAPNLHQWGSIPVLILLALMFIGGCAGSTSGGMKIDRLIILVKFIKNEFYKMVHPGTITTVTVNGKGTTTAIVQKVLAFLLMYGVVLVGGGVVVTLLGVPLKDSLFMSLQSLSNVSLESNIPGANWTFAMLPDAAKLIMSFIMLTGRLELFTILILLTPTFWKR